MSFANADDYRRDNDFTSRFLLLVAPHVTEAHARALAAGSDDAVRATLAAIVLAPTDPALVDTLLARSRSPAQTYRLAIAAVRTGTSSRSLRRRTD